MAGTSTNRSEEFERVRRSEDNTYYSGKEDAASKYNPGFTKARSPKDPNKTTNSTPGPNGRG